MIIKYFASLKERIGVSEETIVSSEISVKETIKILKEKYGEKAFPDNILCSVNHEIVKGEHKIKAQDEVAFFPPVTGG
jgi:molybdopterin synthase sulfur carrier subunit